MAADPFDLWRLALARALLVQAAPRVSLSVFLWHKDPGNQYLTFYPTAWATPDADVWTLLPRVQSRRAHLASYGDRVLQIPWLERHESRFAPTPASTSSCATEREGSCAASPGDDALAHPRPRVPSSRSRSSTS
jgi:hypothetical protein